MYEPCNKIKFTSRKDANDYIYNRDCNVKKNFKGTKRAYKCYYCGYWHLTSQTKKESKSRHKKRFKFREGSI